MSRVSFEALGGELGKYLSHAFNKVSLQNGNQGDGTLRIQAITVRKTENGDAHEFDLRNKSIDDASE